MHNGQDGSWSEISEIVGNDDVTMDGGVAMFIWHSDKR